MTCVLVYTRLIFGAQKRFWCIYCKNKDRSGHCRQNKDRSGHCRQNKDRSGRP